MRTNLKHILMALCIAPALTAAAQSAKIEGGPFTLTRGTPVKVGWSAAKEGVFLVQVADASGKAVRTLDAGWMKPGRSNVDFDGRDFLGRPLPAGEYRVRVVTNPKAAADTSFGVGGLLGTVSKKFTCGKDRAFNLGVSNIDAATVTVKVDGETWKKADGFAAAENSFMVDGTAGMVVLNPKASMQDDADVEVRASAGLPLVNPWDIKTAPDGSVFIVDNLYTYDGDILKAPATERRPGFVYKVSAEGKPAKDFGAAGALKSADTLCSGLAVDAEGTLYFVTPHHIVRVCDPAGKKLRDVGGFTFPKPEGPYGIVSIAVNENKRLVIVNGNAANVIYDATKPGLTGFIAHQNSKQGALFPPVIWRYCGPCVAALGDYYYQTTMYQNLVKYRFDATTHEFHTGWRTPADDPINGMPKGRERLWHAMGVALDGTGLIYVADRMNHRIQVFFDAGTTPKHVCSFGSEGTAVEKCQMKAPHAAALSPDGKSLYVADDGYAYTLGGNPVVWGLARVTKFLLAGEETTEIALTIK